MEENNPRKRAHDGGGEDSGKQPRKEILSVSYMEIAAFIPDCWDPFVNLRRLPEQFVQHLLSAEKGKPSSQPEHGSHKVSFLNIR